jgi:hypothetical protein
MLIMVLGVESNTTSGYIILLYDLMMVYNKERNM